MKNVSSSVGRLEMDNEFERMNQTLGNMSLGNTLIDHMKQKEKLLEEFVKNFQKRVNLYLKHLKLRKELGVQTDSAQVMHNRFVSTLENLVEEFQEVTAELEKLKDDEQAVISIVKKEKVISMNHYLNH